MFQGESLLFWLCDLFCDFKQDVSALSYQAAQADEDILNLGSCFGLISVAAMSIAVVTLVLHSSEHI